MKNIGNTLAGAALAVTLLAAAALVPTTARAGYGQRPITVYFTRHAEKRTTTIERGPAWDTYEAVYSDDTLVTDANSTDDMDVPDGHDSKGANLDEVCGESKCAEELDALGLERAELLADWFRRRGVTRRLDKVIASHKRRTLQTVEPTAMEAGLPVLQFPADGTELQPESTTPSECPTIAEILNSNPGDTVLVAGHSGTLYDIMGEGNDVCAGLGLDTDDDERFPKDEAGKVRDFGDVWKVVIHPGGARFAYRVNLQPKELTVEDHAY